MPIVRKYKKGSILYFEGDPKREIFLIKEGQVVMVYRNLAGDAELNEILRRGDFIGIRNAIAGVPREETVTCVEDAEILAFTPQEFEALLAQTPNIGLKILKILSTNLRSITKEEKKMVTQNAFEDPGNELFKMGLYFFNQKLYSKAITVWERFMHFFPSSSDINEAKKMIHEAQNAMQTGYHPTTLPKGS